MTTTTAKDTMNKQVELNAIPPRLAGLRLCAVDTCVAVATQTVCDQPEVCADEICQQLIACDEHADQLAATAWVMLNRPPSSVEVTPPEGEFGGHD
jgi:hypothetical protein